MDVEKKESLYEVVAQVKAEMNSSSAIISKEEDMLSATENLLKDLKKENESLVTRLIEVQAEVKVADRDYAIILIQKEEVKRCLDDQINKIESFDKKLETLEVTLEEIKTFSNNQKKGCAELYENQKLSYRSFPLIQKYLDATDEYSELSAKSGALSMELEKLKKEFEAKKLEHNSKASAPMGKPNYIPNGNEVEPLRLVMSASPNLQEIAALWAHLAEENRLLKKRLEDLELKSQLQIQAKSIEDLNREIITPPPPPPLTGCTLEASKNLNQSVKAPEPPKSANMNLAHEVATVMDTSEDGQECDLSTNIQMTPTTEVSIGLLAAEGKNPCLSFTPKSAFGAKSDDCSGFSFSIDSPATKEGNSLGLFNFNFSPVGDSFF